MRKILVLGALLLGAALFTGSPAKAELGCTCVKLGAGPACVSGIAECTFRGGGVCILPCDYQPPKMAKKHGHKKKLAKRHGHKKKKKM
jgi:hypothetical protein